MFLRHDQDFVTTHFYSKLFGNGRRITFGDGSLDQDSDGWSDPAAEITQRSSTQRAAPQ